MAGNKKTKAQKKKSFIAGCGGTNVDLLFTGLPRLPAQGEELYSQGFSLLPGGGAPGTLALLRRLGIPVRLQTGLGDDRFSCFAREFFDTEGIALCNLSEGSEGIPVNLSCVMVTPQDRTFVSYTDGIERTEDRARQIYETSKGAAICLMDPIYADVYQQLKAEGSQISFDTGWSDDLSLDRYAHLLTLADYYTPNRKEALKLTGQDSLEAAAKVLAEYLDPVVIKLDASGCLLYQKDSFTIIPAIPGITALDATGAGDAFLAGFLYGMYHGYDAALSVLFGNLTGGECVKAAGCLSASLTEEALLSQAAKWEKLIPQEYSV